MRKAFGIILTIILTLTLMLGLSSCGECQHEDLQSNITAPTCTERGYTTYSCNKCEHSYIDNYVDALGHKSSDWIIDAEPTYEKEGLRHKECTVCSLELENTTIDKLVAPSIEASGVSLNTTALSMTVGETSTLTATVTPSDTTDKNVTWSSSNTAIATVNNGVVTAIGAGSATITVTTSNGKTATCSVTVVNPTVEATGIALNKTEATLKLGESLNLIVTILPEDATDKTVTWQSSDETIAKVVNGAVSTLDMGTVTITATAANGMTAQCVITVNGNAVIQYERSGGFYIVTGIEGKTDKLEIPFLYDGLRVRAIKANAFYGNTHLKEVIIPNSLEYIYANAFMNCSNLERINLPESLTFIGESAFENCVSLKEITIPSLTETISKKAFYNCTALKALTICDGVKAIGESTFAKCSALETATAGNGLETISDYAFDSCTSLKRFEMPNTVKYLGDFAFRYAESLDNVTFSNGLTAIGIGCFQSCVSLDNVELHAGIVSFGESCFSWCSGMKTLRILGDVTLLGNSSFYECTGLENVYYASSISGDLGLNNYVFYNAGTNGNGIVFTLSANACIPERLFEPQDNKNRPKLVKLIVEDGATKVDYFSTYNTLPYLAEIELPDTITHIEKGCFDNTAWWNNLADGAAYICDIFYGYKGTLTGELEISNSTVCVAMGALEGQKPASLIIPFVGAIANGSENTHFGYIFDAVTADMQKDYIPAELISVTVNNCQYTIEKTAFKDCSFTVNLDHHWGDWAITHNETCQTEGEEEKTCSVCELVESRPRAIDTNAHSASSAWTNDAHNHWHKCTIEGCDKILGETEHSWGEWVVTLEPTCQTQGSQYHICNECNYKGTGTIPVDSSAHNYATTWTNDGNHHWYKCTIEGCTSRKDVTAHDWGEWVVTTKATCQTEGYRYHICKDCNYQSAMVSYTDATAHDYAIDWITDGDSHWHKCTVTGCSSKKDMGGHEWNEWVVTLEPTCQTTGSRYRTCKVCNYTTTETIAVDPSAHSYETSWTSDSDSHWHKCTIAGCSHKKDTGEHDWNDDMICTICKHFAFEFFFDSQSQSYYISKYTGDATIVEIPATYRGCPVTKIAPYAFSECKNLISITIPASVNSIGEAAFYGCSSIEIITLPFVGESKFSTVANESTLFGYIFGTSAYTGGNKTVQYYSHIEGETYATYYIPTTLKSVNITGGNILFGAFHNCENIENIILGNGVTTIDEYAFFGCGIKNIVIPDTVKEIGGWAFLYCDNLVSVVIGDNVSSIGVGAFAGCNNLVSVTISKSVQSIGDSAFSNNPKLVEVINHSSLQLAIGSSDYGGIAFYAKEIHSEASKIVNVKDYLFFKHGGINYLLGYIGNEKRIVLPDEYEGGSYEIYTKAFYSCYNLESVIIGNSVTAIGNLSFCCCENVKEVIIGENVKSIGDYAFSSCNNLVTIIIPKSVTYIGEGGLQYCSNLKVINYTGTITQWDAVVKNDEWDYRTEYTIIYNYIGE